MKKYYFLILMLLSATISQAQNNRDYIRKCIEKWGECRNVAITKYGGDLALYSSNGWAASGVPAQLQSTLRDLHDKNEYIDDVQLTENGSYIVLYGDNGIVFSGIPYSLEKKLREFNSNGEVITSVTFNDDGDWIVITKEHYSASDQRILDWMQEGSKKFGLIWAAHMTDDACVVVFENGFRTLGDIPESLDRAMKNTSINIFRLKFAGSSWFFADFNGHYQYHM